MSPPTRLSGARPWWLKVTSRGPIGVATDNRPLMGPYAEQKRLYLATGHEGLGITTSLGTAKLLVAQLMNRDAAIPIAPYLPARMVQEPVHA